MTYISAFHVATGIVLCADTQETVEDEKRNVEKIACVEDGIYALAVAGAGLGEAVDAFTQELIDRVSKEKPATASDLRATIESAINEVLTQDAPLSSWSEEYGTAEYVIAAKPPEGQFVIYRVKGRRIYPVKQLVVIGYATAANEALLARMHRDNLSMQQGVMLAVFAVAQSKEIDTYVGGQTRVAVVVANRACMDDPEYIMHAEERVNDFRRLTDTFLMYAVDGSVAPSDFSKRTTEFNAAVEASRKEFLHWSAAHHLNRAFNDPNYAGDPYPKEFLGCVTTVMGDGSIVVREETREEIETRRQMYEDAKQEFNKLEGHKFVSLIEGRQARYIGEERVHVRGTTGPVADKVSTS